MENKLNLEKGILFLLAAILFLGFLFEIKPALAPKINSEKNAETERAVNLEEKVTPQGGIELSVIWGDLGAKMLSVGVISREKLENLYAQRGGLNEEEKELIFGSENGNLKITPQNSAFLLNLLWALGLGNKNEILERGPMTSYDGRIPAFREEGIAKAKNFASTAGWTLAEGNQMDHYSRHPFIVLSSAEQEIAERVSQNIYRPCCDNPAHFPDCNHGLAMLGLIELMASQKIPEEKMYKIALQANSYWFAENYLNIARYSESRGLDWFKASPKVILGKEVSGLSGYQNVLQKLESRPESGANNCAA